MKGLFSLVARVPLLVCGVVLGSGIFSAYGASVTVGGEEGRNEIMDKWLYGNAPGPTYGGDRKTSSIFATLNSTDEDRMAAYLLGFNTSADIPTGRGASNYLIQSITLWLTVSGNETFLYDSNYDSYRNYLTPGSPNYQADSDAGHPLELYGVGLRNGYTGLSGSISGNTKPYGENEAYGGTGQVHTRSAYPLSFNGSGSPIDVSDNVSEAFESSPWAIGRTQSVAPGDAVPGFTEFAFELDLTNPYVLAYFQKALNDGVVGLMVSSLHSSEGQGGSQIYPIFLTEEGAAFPEDFPRLQINYTVVPEPNASVILLVGCALFATGRAWRNRSSLV